MEYTLADLLPRVVEMPVEHPTLGLLPVKIKLQGIHTPSVKQKSLEAMVHLKSVDKVTKSEEMIKLVSNIEKTAAESAAAAIVGWDNDELLGGTFSPDYALKLMSNPEMSWLREQVNKFVGDQNNFFRQPN